MQTVVRNEMECDHGGKPATECENLACVRLQLGQARIARDEAHDAMNKATRDLQDLRGRIEQLEDKAAEAAKKNVAEAQG